ncbi:MAG: hypothetical protein ACI80V_002016 [Rhodothermales bacterium]|jgi:hypothetical protein
MKQPIAKTAAFLAAILAITYRDNGAFCGVWGVGSVDRSGVDRARESGRFYRSQPLRIDDLASAISPLPIRMATSGITIAGVPMMLMASDRNQT